MHLFINETDRHRHPDEQHYGQDLQSEVRLKWINAHRTQHQHVHSARADDQRAHLKQHALQEIYIDQRDKFFFDCARHF